MTDDGDEGQHVFPVPPKLPWWRPYWDSFTDQLPKVFGKQMALGLVGVFVLALGWLWGWIAGGGLTRAAGAIPAGAVVAFDLKTGCPAGWKDLDEAVGRMVVGADPPDWSGARNLDENGKPLTARQFRVAGGTESKALDPKNLPAMTLQSEDLKLVDVSDSGNASVTAIVRTLNNVGKTNIQSQLPGSDQPIDKMPPYIPLMYCKYG
jgi:hypothetical protein